MLELMKKRKSVLGNENGLTLVELLAVIVILAIIAAIAIPSIGGVINGTKTKAHNSNAVMIIDAARYLTINAKVVPEKATLSDLVTGGYLNSIPQDPANKQSTYEGTNSFVTITNDAMKGYSFSITLVSSGETPHTYYNNISEDLIKKGEDAK